MQDFGVSVLPWEFLSEGGLRFGGLLFEEATLLDGSELRNLQG